MTKEQAKEALRRYRTAQDVSEDPELAVALELTKSDALLSAFLKQQEAFFQTVRLGLRTPSPPANLKERILEAGFRSKGTPGNQAEIITFPWKTLVPLAAAALFAVLLGVTAIWLGSSREPDRFADFRERTARIALRDYNRMDKKSTNSIEIRSYLAEHSSFGNFSIPKGLENATIFGCAVLPWRDIPTGMVCFKRGGGTNNLVWLFMIESPSVLGAPPAGKPEFRLIGQFSTASWSVGGKAYVLGLVGTEADVKQYL